MKKKLIYMAVALLCASGGLHACYYDTVATFEGVPTNVSLKNDVQPIFDRSCNKSGCHDSGPAHAPGLIYPDTYNNIINGNYVNVADPTKSVLYLVIEGGQMPPGGPPLSDNEKKLILGWITDGAKNN